MNCSTPGLPVHHQLPEFTQTHVHRVSHAIQPSHPLSSPFSSCPQSLPASGSFPMNWLFESGSQSTGASASTLILLINIQGLFPLGFDLLAVQSTRESLLQQTGKSTMLGEVPVSAWFQAGSEVNVVPQLLSHWSVKEAGFCTKSHPFGGVGAT